MELAWDDLRVVLAVHRGRTVRVAARALGVDRTTVLRRLDAAERALGTRLFERRRDGCVPTRAGARLLPQAIEIEESITSLVAGVAQDDRRAHGDVRVTLPEFVATAIVVPAVAGFAERYPDVTLRLDVGHALVNLGRRDADIAIRNVRPSQRQLVFRKLGVAGFGLYASRAYLRRFGRPDGDWSGHRLVLYDESLAQTAGYARVVEETRGARIVLRSTETQPLIAAARDGVGIAFLPSAAAHADPALELVPPGVVGRTEVVAVTHAELRSVERIRVTMALLVELFAANAATIEGRS